MLRDESLGKLGEQAGSNGDICEDGWNIRRVLVPITLHHTFRHYEAHVSRGVAAQGKYCTYVLFSRERTFSL